MREVLLIRFGEVHLKGLNRPYFLKKLTDNVRRAVADTGAEVWLADSRIYVAGAGDMDETAKRVAKVFGIHSLSRAWELEKDYGAISAACVSLAGEMSGTFKVLCRRSDKRFPINSMQMDADLGHDILEACPRLSVDVHKPDHEICVEIRDHAYVYSAAIPAVGGLPMGTGGKALLLLSGGIDSPVAGFSLMKRGVRVDAIHFFSPPYTGERARAKVLALADILAGYGGGMRVHVVPFTEAQLAIHDACDEGLGTVLTRRMMTRIAERLARNIRAQALITGESLGQVASQTMEALGCTDMVAGMPIFRPLIGMDKLEIIGKANEIGTYETSILPYEDCCTVFTPRHPVTHPKPAALEAAEEKLDVEALITRALEGIEVIDR